MDAKTYRNTQLESGEGFNPFERKEELAARAKADAVMADLIARKHEVRAAWNAAVAAHTVNGRVAASALPKIERMAGVTQIQMKLLKPHFA